MKSIVAPLLVVAGLALLPPSAPAQTFALGTPNRVEWETTTRGGRSIVSGYVYNDREMRIEHVRLRIEPTGPEGRATWSYVSGTIDPWGRGYFEASLPSTTGAYRVLIESFDWARCGDG